MQPKASHHSETPDASPPGAVPPSSCVVRPIYQTFAPFSYSPSWLASSSFARQPHPTSIPLPPSIQIFNRSFQFPRRWILLRHHEIVENPASIFIQHVILPEDGVENVRLLRNNRLEG